MDTYVKLGPLAQAALEALVAGAGIAVFFALGLRGLALWTGPDAADVGPAPGAGHPGPTATRGSSRRRNPVGLVLAVAWFAIVVAIVLVGLYVMFTSK